MSPDTSQWRSSSSYDYVDHLTAPDIGWEWLRRNEDYQRDFSEFRSGSKESPPQIERVARRWGLRFPCRPGSEVERGASVLASAGRYRNGGPDTGASIGRC